MSRFSGRFYQKDWFLPVLLSLLLHAVCLLAAFFIRVSHLSDLPEKESMSFKLSKAHVQDFPLQKKGNTSSSSAKQSTAEFRDPSQGLKALRQMPEPSIEPRITVEEINQIPVEPKVSGHSVLGGNLDTIIFESQKEEVNQKLVVKQESTSDYYQKTAEKSVRVTPMDGQGLVRTLAKPMKDIDLYAPESMSVDPEEGMPGFTPVQGVFGGAEAYEGLREEQGKITDFEALDEFLDIQVYKYEDPSDGEKYFMIKIFAKPGVKSFKVMPKEILFTIDCSLSINADRLSEFKQGIAYCLKHLNEGDVFNIVAFKDKVTFFSPVSLTPTTENIKQAERFVAGLFSNQATDMYEAFSGIIEKPLMKKPSNIILISDGKPTNGIVGSRELINSVTKLNRKERPVFAFSGGSKVNRYLLDFIAYQNRGWSQYIRQARDVSEGLAVFYEKIRDPIFLNLRYRLNGLDEAGVYPKSLPDFYRNAEFTLYGRYDKEDLFSMQLLGDVNDKTKELIFSRALNEAQKGTEDIKHAWAFNKAYHLIGQITEKGQSADYRSQLEDLSRRYGVTTPYSVELEKTD